MQETFRSSIHRIIGDLEIIRDSLLRAKASETYSGSRMGIVVAKMNAEYLPRKLDSLLHDFRDCGHPYEYDRTALCSACEAKEDK